MGDVRPSEDVSGDSDVTRFESHKKPVHEGDIRLHEVEGNCWCGKHHILPCPHEGWMQTHDNEIID